MLRYNHGMIERKWRETWQQDQRVDQESAQVCTVPVPGDSGELGMENARLLVLTDFFSSVQLGKKAPISILGAKESWLKDTNKLGLVALNGAINGEYDLAVIPRDYAAAFGKLEARDTFICGRLLQSGSMRDLLPDFGADALRIYFLYMGPPARDYVFQWHGLASAYRFLSRFWELGYESVGDPGCELSETTCLLDLRVQVRRRILQRKPHTALAAIMGYIKGRSILTRTEVRVIATLLQPFTPFLSTELLQLMATIKN
ncbi:MAG TPA: hypothetical protein DDZ66_07510 [Firmicutes bacterium]|jgi:leucyl-tRNA synthetase|nr:hypothetical protein [Bacillota bacterium]